MASSHLRPYTFAPLPFERSIRVLEIESGDELATLHCRLLSVHLDDPHATPYVAISYTWGKPVFSEIVMIDDDYLEITPSLSGALRQFRASSCLKWVWVDAVCINQKDNVEKSTQIPLMSDIYRNASRVMVWLGDSPEHVELLLAVRQASRRLSVNPGQTNGWKLQLATQIELLAQLPWFSRRWVIQELAMNSSVFLMCAGIQLDWLRLVGVVSYLFSGFEGYTSSGRIVDKSDFNGKMFEQYSSHSISSLLNLRSLWQTHSAPYTMTMSEHIGSARLLHILSRFHDFKCQDDRDLIYTLLGVAGDVNNPDHEKYNIEILPDYSRTVEQVYIDLALSLVRAGLLHATLHCALARTTTNNNGLPSWVPDWRINPRDAVDAVEQAMDDIEPVGIKSQGPYHVVSLKTWCTYYWYGSDAGMRNYANHGSAPKSKNRAEGGILFKNPTPLVVVFTSSTYREKSEWAVWATSVITDIWAHHFLRPDLANAAKTGIPIWEALIVHALYSLVGGFDSSGVSSLKETILEALREIGPLPVGGPGSEVILEEWRWIIGDILQFFLRERKFSKDKEAKRPVSVFVCAASPTLPGQGGTSAIGCVLSRNNNIQVGDVVLNLPQHDFPGLLRQAWIMPSTASGRPCLD
ncbi:hypothetical protein FHL15_011051 [Xylaria flabelliformis]|uniref:Heterokaryon incompatibility domain-containing protein n=1 Tax=Xylaria flabelliformis TaxID=2512241 RepID=A0A553HJC5_9PEZI|nr:hypothetical protein FHL15_011051 [Xylaria flabelliformis]